VNPGKKSVSKTEKKDAINDKMSKITK